jgi:hypothetical protein
MEKSLTLENRDPGQLPEIGTDDHHDYSGVNRLSVQLISWDRVSRRQCGKAGRYGGALDWQDVAQGARNYLQKK